MLNRIKFEIVQLLARVRIRSEEEVEAMEQQQRRQAEAQARTMQFQHAEAAGFAAGEELAETAPDAAGGIPQVREAPKVGRNDPCPCCRVAANGSRIIPRPPSSRHLRLLVAILATAKCAASVIAGAA